MRKGVDILAIALWAFYISILPDNYRDIGGILGTAVLAAFLTLYNRKLAESEMDASLRQTMEELDIEDNVKEQLYTEIKTFLKSKKRGVYFKVFRIKTNESQ
ncbi:hypothetical protein [Thermococcus sp.]|uniref:hypothetical protein n=1 Tax=Thermococcus sp. TaxID=35749 RepID=UPI00261D5A6C|nr:hypothetical protein [Thermococcus sp.]